MTNNIKIDVQRTGFPIEIGEVKLWFDSSLESLKNFMNVEVLAQEKLKEAREKAQHIHFPKPEDINADNVRDIDTKTIDAAFDVGKEFIAAQYDIIFGDGTFKKIYKRYPDILALEQALTPVANAIAEQIEKQESDRSEQVNLMKKQLLDKKQAKRS